MKIDIKKAADVQKLIYKNIDTDEITRKFHSDTSITYMVKVGKKYTSISIFNSIMRLTVEDIAKIFDNIHLYKLVSAVEKPYMSMPHNGIHLVVAHDGTQW